MLCAFAPLANTVEKQNKTLSIFAQEILASKLYLFYEQGGGSTRCCRPLITTQQSRASLSTAGVARSSRPLTWPLGFATERKSKATNFLRLIALGIVIYLIFEIATLVAAIFLSL